MAGTAAYSSNGFAEILELRPKSIFEVVPYEVFVEHGELGWEFLSAGNCYEWKYAIARWLQPRTIVEVGVRYGYSLCCFAAGANEIARLTAIDNGCYKADWAEKTKEALSKLKQRPEIVFVHGDACELEELPASDFCHIDGPHRYDDTLKLLRKANSKAILVDDTFNCLDDMRAVRQFCQENQERMRDLIHIPSHVGESLILLD